MVKDIKIPQEFGVKWKNKFLRPSKHAYFEMANLGLDLYDIQSILELGYNCNKQKRSKDTIEKCFKKGKKEFKVVIIKSYSFDIDDDVWLIKHVGGK